MITEKRRAFSHLNLRFNPFGELQKRDRAALALVDCTPMREHLQNPNTAIQLLAPHGRGKTTHLLALYNHFPEGQYIKITEDLLFTISEAPIHFIDSIDLLPKAKRQKIYSIADSLVYTTHTDLSREIPPEYITKSFTISNNCSETIMKIFARRIEFARRGPGPIPGISSGSLHSLTEQYGDNIRAMEWHLYEQFQSLKEIHDV